MSRVALNIDNYEGNDAPTDEVARFVVLYGKASTRKHKIWEGDGLLVCYNDSCILKSEDERDVICRSSALKSLDQLEDGRVINIGSWSVEIQERVDCAPTKSEPESKPSSSFKPPPIAARSSPGNQSFTVPAPTPPSKFVARSPLVTPAENVENRKRLAMESQDLKLETPKQPQKRASFVPPLIGSTTSDGLTTTSIQEKIPPFILNEQDILDRKTTSAITVDPRFARQLRDHQKEGVRFIFDRLKGETGGAILADDMGLGKSIQTMAATWALLRGSKAGSAQIANSCLIIVPSSLVNNWKAEFDKWWRLMRFPAVLAQTAKDISSYQSTIKQMPYLIISYDMAQRHVDKLAIIHFDVLVCDEGHKLKNLDGKLRKALLSLEIPRRLILTGTPMQNDFDEFYSLLDFVRPSQFGSLASFRSMCNDKPEELNEWVDDCMLRRTAAEVNLTHLPEKHEYILFCAASEIQKNIHSEICDYMTGDALSLIFFARQLANHPKLLLDNLREKNDKSASKSLKQVQKHAALLLAFDGPNMPRGGVRESGKLLALVDMLKCFRVLQECAVIVSNYIETLDMIEQLCEYLEFKVFRLDGKTQVQDRQKLVRKFNDDRNPSNIFLLSTKAGGVGLNLIGASRLVLFDSDWNPANDQQAMARIWRDGQVRPCHIYRLITTGTIEEKMLQRQIKKTGLGCVIDAIEVGESVSTFTDEDLKDIFTFTGDQTECNTHDLCGCPCDGCGMLENEMDDEEESSEENGDEDEIVEETPMIPKKKSVSVPSEDWDSDDDEDVDDEEMETNSTLTEEVPDTQEGTSSGGAPQKINPKKPTDNSEKKASKPPQTIASLAELSRWRHFSPRHPDTWHHFMVKAGFSQEDFDVDLTFAFYQESQF
uniref:DNA repair and recombination protein RAD54-like n=1 Tax=Caenorhabditis tropicalis TaxID=1561998 RepID=A0A1I7SXR4_9PELO